ncbi:glycosyltransferase family 87 protein [Streptomyces sp. NPDC050804]|uniref:glycosyltransferase family 87 protein n=1 Tax=Streptomyces sp. NPDC050804 TaxID=3154745 RepID=UPI0034367625
MRSLRTTVSALLVAALAVTLVLTVRKDSYHTDPVGLSWWYAASWTLFAAAVWSLRKVPARQAVTLVLTGAVVIAATGLVAAPRTSTDSFRYAWDGRVQAAGISPYDHAPADPALTRLRDEWLFPRGAACTGPDRTPVTERTCTRINRPQVPTIYPPVAEGYFLLVHELSPPGVRHKGLQTGAALLSVMTSGALLMILRRRGDPRNAAFWAWCPAVPVEAVNNAHVDVLAVLLSVAALGVVVRHRTTGGALLGLAITAKLLPAILLPGALSGVRRGRDAVAVTLPAAVAVGLVYLPYVLGSHASVLGYLGGYAEEEGYEDASARSRYALLRLLVPDSWALPVVGAVMLAVVGYVLRRGDPERPWSGALLVTGTAFLVMTPGYSWYALLLVALVALDGRWEWLGVAVAGTAAYVTGRALGGETGTVAYTLAAVAVLAGWVVRRRRAGTGQGPERKLTCEEGVVSAGPLPAPAPGPTPALAPSEESGTGRAEADDGNRDRPVEQVVGGKNRGVGRCSGPQQRGQGDESQRTDGQQTAS